MATFCGNCGAPTSGAFCGNCGAGAARQVNAALPSAAVAPVASASVSGLKIVLIVVGVLFFFGVLGLAGVYFAGRSLIRSAEVASGAAGSALGVPATRSSNSGGLFSSVRNAVVRHRDGCALLPPDEVASILGVEVGRADGNKTGDEAKEQCDYFLKPGTSDAYAEKLKESVQAAQQQADKPDASVNSLRELSERSRKSGAESVIKNMIRAGGAVANDGSEPFFSFTVEREGGRKTFGILERTSSAGRVLLNGADLVEKLPGVGERAFLTPLDSSLIVLQGDTCLTLNLTQVPDGKVKGSELAKRMLSRL